MTETIEQFAVRVCEILGNIPDGRTYRTLTAELPAFLAQHRQVVEVTGEDYAEAIRKHYTGVVPELYARRVEVINARLRARAVPASRPALDVAPIVGHDGGTWPATSDGMAWAIAFNRQFQSVSVDDALGWFCNAIMGERDRHATDTGWITAPTTQTAGELRVPDTGYYALRHYQDGVPSFWHLIAGLPVADEHDAIRRIDTDAPTTWIERTPTTTRAWTAESVPEGHILAELPQESPDAPDGAVYCFHRMVRRVQVADQLNTLGAVRIYAVKPQDGPR
jgi:hypothetical protein